MSINYKINKNTIFFQNAFQHYTNLCFLNLYLPSVFIFHSQVISVLVLLSNYKLFTFLYVKINIKNNNIIQ